MEFGRPIEAFSEDELREYAREHVLYAAHFYKEWKAPELNIYLQEARRMADKHVAHLPRPKNGRNRRRALW